MTPVSISLTLVGLVTLFWPLATLLCKRNVLKAQWLMMLAMSLLGFSFILLGCLFNTFLMGEYLLLLLFLMVLIVSPPIIHVALTVLTQPSAHITNTRILFLPSLFCIALMIVSLIIGGVDVYRLWTIRGAMGMSWTFFPNSMRYNFVVFVNTYLFWAVFAFEFIYIFITGFRQFIRFKRINSEYYTSDRFNNINLRGIYIAANIGMIVMVLSQLTNPFAENHRFLLYFTYCAPLALITFYIGRSVYMINNGAEQLPANRSSLTVSRSPLLENYVEKEQAFLNPDISVFMLAEHFHTSEDDIIDVIHRRHGTTFGDYIDSLRIEYASMQILGGCSLQLDSPDDMNRFAHQCGYLNANDLQRAFFSVMQISLVEWCRNRGLVTAKN